jgi:hypothetical protein
MGLLYAAEFQLDSNGIAVHRGQIASVFAVPEPSSLLLLLPGLAYGRRRYTDLNSPGM